MFCPVLTNADRRPFLCHQSVLCVCVRVCVRMHYVVVLMPLFIFTVGSIPDEAKALSLLAPANAVAGMMPGGGLLPTPNPMPNPAVRLHMHISIHICDVLYFPDLYIERTSV